MTFVTFVFTEKRAHIKIAVLMRNMIQKSVPGLGQSIFEQTNFVWARTKFAATFGSCLSVQFVGLKL